MPGRIFIKICGITLPEDAEYAVSAGADAVGFIAYPGSPRYIPPQKVKKICSEQVPDNLKKVGVFVNASPDVISEYISAGINTIQLHGDENAEYALKFTGLAEVWKAVRPQNKDSVLQYCGYPASKFLIDTFHKKLHGGTGTAVDSRLAEFAVANLPAPVIIAGGIKPENCVEIFNAAEPYGLDINSGVEKSPGIKDHIQIRRFFEKIRNLI